MSMHPRKPIKKPEQRVDLSQAETIKCEHCENPFFINATILKRLSALVSPTGQEAIVPIEVYSCGSCGQVPKSMLAGSGLSEKETDN